MAKSEQHRASPNRPSPAQSAFRTSLIAEADASKPASARQRGEEAGLTPSGVYAIRKTNRYKKETEMAKAKTPAPRSKTKLAAHRERLHEIYDKAMKGTKPDLKTALAVEKTLLDIDGLAKGAEPAAKLEDDSKEDSKEVLKGLRKAGAQVKADKHRQEGPAKPPTPVPDDD